MSKITRLLYLLLPLALTGCNDEIFVEPVKDVVNSIWVSGDNGTTVFSIQKDGLTWISFDNNMDYDAEAWFYDKDGENLGQAFDFGKVASILYYSHNFALEFKMQGDKIELTAVDNSYPFEIEVKAFLSYGYTTKAVTIHIGAGRPLEIHYIGYDTLNPIVGTVDKKGHWRYVNQSESTIKIMVYPYREVRSSLLLIPDESWADGVTGIVRAPAYVDGEWNIRYFDEVEATIGSDTNFTSAITPDVTTYVEVPPYSTIDIVLTVTFASLETKFSAEIQLPNSQISWLTAGRWVQYQPISYQIDSTIEE